MPKTAQPERSCADMDPCCVAPVRESSPGVGGPFTIAVLCKHRDPDTVARHRQPAQCRATPGLRGADTVEDAGGRGSGLGCGRVRSAWWIGKVQVTQVPLPGSVSR